MKSEGPSLNPEDDFETFGLKNCQPIKIEESLD